ncbi:MAG: DUF2130 domain-containing protein [Bacteroidales bacterium]|nr:DUF2130 domain-containing protein [Bacteroidales bacterium]
MKELKCPKCGSVFQVDEADYASIVSQVKNAEFDAELRRRLEEMHVRQQAERELDKSKVEQTFQNQLNQQRVELSNKQTEIERLNGQLRNIATQKQNEMQSALAAKDQEIIQLRSTIAQNNSALQVAVLQEHNRAQQALQSKNEEIAKLQNTLHEKSIQAKEHEDSLNKSFEEQKRMLQEQVDYYKDLKTRMSTKMVGETLEQHCYNQFEQYIRPFMPNAYFDKDNDAVDGTKGDFIFRDSEDGTEYISIMFEMKNEMDTTATKHRNDDFLKKLDEDRHKKGCEFAVLVSLLEADNELYNNGIVNKSHLYPKMYVIRPQFFVPFINLLVQASRKSLEYKKQLILAQNREVDVTNFENKIEDFKTKFGRHYELASKKFEDAIRQIDDTITKLQKLKENLVGSENNLRLAQKDTEDLSIRRLTYRNPTMKAKFDEARKANGSDGLLGDE